MLSANNHRLGDVLFISALDLCNCANRATVPQVVQGAQDLRLDGSNTHI